MDKLVIIGTSIAANNIYKFVEKYHLYDVVGFAVNKEYKTQDVFLDKPVYELDKTTSKN